jgi:aerobic carbon-monoxide dehydrogenase small subunit
MNISFTLNGKDMKIDLPPERRVVDFLREDLGLTGTKEGCGAGECGACTIMVNKEPVLSCLMLCIQLEGKNILTIEGLEDDKKGKIIQEAFIKYGAVQCGFCTPGMVLSAMDILENNPAPSGEEIKIGISGNLCRCTGYQKIVDAIENAGRLIREEKL